MKTIKIDRCEGYLWMSNQEKPKVYQAKPLEVNLDEQSNPFIVEGQLYDLEKKESYSIKYVDGRYLICIHKVEPAKTGQVIEETNYLSNRMSNLWLNFLRYWEEKTDENCMGMPVLTLTKSVFVGFKT